VDVVLLRSGAQLEAAARLLWDVWGADTEASRTELVSAGMLRSLAHAGNYVAGAYVDGALAGCTVAFFGARDGRVDHLHSDITGVASAGQGRGVGFALKQHQREWALERGLRAITWTFDPLLTRNAHFNLCKLGARVTDYRADFYGELSDRLLVEWVLDASAEPGGRRYAVAGPGSEVISPGAGRLAVRERFLGLLGAGYRVAGLSREGEYVLVPS
jgi:predicted GNAT superfamily acetyltransferase